jgi:hypothetical protein
LDAYAKIFLDLLRYVSYLKGENVRIQHSLSGLPQSYQEKIEFDRPKTLEDTLRKEIVSMTNPSIGRSLLRIGRERISPYFIGMDLIHLNIRI